VVLRVLGRRHTLRQRDHWTPQQLQAHQARALRQLREHAYAHSPFYQQFHAGRTDRPLQELPVLTKAMVMEHFDELVTDPTVTLAEVEAHLAAIQGNERFRGRYWVAATSGTTGRRGIFLWDLDEWVTVLASYNRSLDWAGATAGLTRRVRMAVVSSTIPGTSRAGSGPPSTAPGFRPSASTPATRWSTSSNGWTAFSRRSWSATPRCCSCWPLSSSPAAWPSLPRSSSAPLRS
jgi:phenylacetate-CoA ligase